MTTNYPVLQGFFHILAYNECANAIAVARNRVSPLGHRLDASYIVPLRADTARDLGDLPGYLGWLVDRLDVIVVDGSPQHVFAVHAASLPPRVDHIVADPRLRTVNGKVGSVLTGVCRATHECLIIADDDVRFDDQSLSRILALLRTADVVRPQNYFDQHPWHVLWDTGRTLLNRVSGGDWPGTLAVRRSRLRAAGGYDGSVMFENLELVRTILATGGREVVPLDLYVGRTAPSADHFWSQRVRQAYDELARPPRMLVSLSLLPGFLLLLARRRWKPLAVVTLGIVAAAEVGRRRAGGARYFPVVGSLLAPVWVLERAVCIWLALLARLIFGGIIYRGAIVRRAATPVRVLRARTGNSDHNHARQS